MRRRVQRCAGLPARKQLCVRTGSQQHLILHRPQHGKHRIQKRRVGLRGHEPCACAGPPALRIQPGNAQIERAQQQKLPVLLQRLPEPLQRRVRRTAAKLRQPEGRELRRQQNAVLPACKRCVPRQMAADLRLGKVAAQQVRFALHGMLRAAAVAVRDLVIKRHTVAHLRVFRVQLPGCAVEHHENGRGAEGPRAAEVNAACRARHAFAGRAVQHAHGGDVVIAQKAHHKVAFAEIIFPFLFAERAARLQRVQQQRPQTQQLRNFAEGKELAHQHADRVRVPPQHILRAVPAPGEQHLPVLATDRFAAVRRCRTQQPVPVARLPEQLRSRQVLPCAFIPAAKPRAGVRLRVLRQKGEFPAQQLPQHMVAAVDAGAAFDDERVVVRQIVQQRVRVRLPPDEGGLFGGERLRHADVQQKETPPFVQRLKHDLLHERVHALRVKAPYARLRVGAEHEIDHGNPALADGQERLRLPLGKRQAAAPGVLQQLLLRQPQIRRAQLQQAAAEAQLLRLRKDLVARKKDQMRLRRQALGQKRDELRCLAAGKQVHVVQNEPDGRLARQRILHQLQQLLPRVRAVRVAERTQLRRQLRRGVQSPAESGPEFLPSAAGEKLPEQIRVRRFGGNAPLQILRGSRLAVARGGYDGRDRVAGGVRKP